MACRRVRLTFGLTLLETAVSVVLIAVLLSILLPALSSARSHSFRDRCAANLQRIGQAWRTYLSDHNNQFPTVSTQPGWMYGGVLFSVVNDNAFPDNKRPLTPYLPMFLTNDTSDIVWCCPGDHGIEDPRLGAGTSHRTAFRSYGNSYRANASLLNWHGPMHVDADDSAVQDETPLPMIDNNGPRGLHRMEITTAPSRLVLCGDALWHEVAESTGRVANWHRTPDAGNLLFLDGSVRFITVRPKEIIGPVVFDPMMRGSARVIPDAIIAPPPRE